MLIVNELTNIIRVIVIKNIKHVEKNIYVPRMNLLLLNLELSLKKTIFYFFIFAMTISLSTIMNINKMKIMKLSQPIT